jgi:hypothetical protein
MENQNYNGKLDTNTISEDNPFYCVTCDTFVNSDHFPHADIQPTRNVGTLPPEWQKLVDESSARTGCIF